MRLMARPERTTLESDDLIRATIHPLRGVRAAAYGAGLGILWGIAMRAWMRFISTDPEFSWAGTIFIIGASAIAGGLLAFARHRRSLGGIGWWRSSFVALMLLGAGGAVMWPTVILGAIAIGRRHLRWIVVFGIAAAVAQVPVLQDAIFDNRRLDGVGQAIATVIYLPLLITEVWAFSVAFRPSIDVAPVPGVTKRILIWAPVVAMSVLGLVLVGAGGM